MVKEKQRRDLPPPRDLAELGRLDGVLLPRREVDQNPLDCGIVGVCHPAVCTASASAQSQAQDHHEPV